MFFVVVFVCLFVCFVVVGGVLFWFGFFLIYVIYDPMEIFYPPPGRRADDKPTGQFQISGALTAGDPGTDELLSAVLMSSPKLS